MNFLNKAIILVAFVFCGALAQADQCSWNDKSTASVTRAFLAFYPGDVYTYCEPCGDTAMSSVYIGYDYEATKDGRAIHFREQTKQTDAGDTVWQFAINEAYADAGIQREIDLAYTFIKTPAGDFLNLGARMSCTNNKFWNPNSDADFSGVPQGVSVWIKGGTVPVVEDVTELDYMKAHEVVYPEKPQG